MIRKTQLLDRFDSSSRKIQKQIDRKMKRENQEANLDRWISTAVEDLPSFDGDDCNSHEIKAFFEI